MGALLINNLQTDKSVMRCNRLGDMGGCVQRHVVSRTLGLVTDCRVSVIYTTGKTTPPLFPTCDRRYSRGASGFCSVHWFAVPTIPTHSFKEKAMSNQVAITEAVSLEASIYTVVSKSGKETKMGVARAIHKAPTAMRQAIAMQAQHKLADNQNWKSVMTDVMAVFPPSTIKVKDRTA